MSIAGLCTVTFVEESIFSARVNQPRDHRASNKPDSRGPRMGLVLACLSGCGAGMPCDSSRHVIVFMAHHICVDREISSMKTKLRAACIFTGISLALVTGCSGHPAHTANMEPADLAAVSIKTLCDAAFGLDGYQPTPAIEMEVARRGLNCKNVTLNARRP